MRIELHAACPVSKPSRYLFTRALLNKINNSADSASAFHRPRGRYLASYIDARGGETCSTMTRIRNRKNIHAPTHNPSLLVVLPHVSRDAATRLPSTAIKSQDPASSCLLRLQQRVNISAAGIFPFAWSFLMMSPSHDNNRILPLPIRVTPDKLV